jgi:radical SAM-linked protein
MSAPVPTNQLPQAVMRLRLTYAKQGAQRYTGHLDFQRVWERILHRSRLPVAYSRGFHPQARLNLACALPLGVTSRCEVLDVWLSGLAQPDQAAAVLRPVLPPGIELLNIEEVDLHAPALQMLVRSSDYEALLLDPTDPTNLEARIHELLSAGTIIRQRRDKDYDLRPLVEDLYLIPSAPGQSLRLAMRLSAREGATGRPDEVLSALGLDPYAARIMRTALAFAER